MHCPFCKNPETKVVDSRVSEDGLTIRRRRECLKCGERFNSFERVEMIPLMIQKKNGNIVPFDHEKLLKSLLTATAKRNIPIEKLINLVADIETHLQNEYRGKNVPSSILGDEILVRLMNIDLVAYIRFASVYKEFKDLNEFTDELNRISNMQQ